MKFALNLIDYILTVLPFFILFNTFIIAKYRAFIPICNFYTLLKEYKNTVYLNNWHYIYLLWFFPFAILDTFIALKKLDTTLISLVYSSVSTLFAILLFYPLMYKKLYQIIFFCVVGINFLVNISFSFSLINSITFKILTLIPSLYIIAVSLLLTRKLTNEELTLHDPLPETLDKQTRKNILKSRKCLLVKQL